MKEVYLDNSATTKVCDTAVKEAVATMTQNYGNPSSGHALGVMAEDVLDESRRVVSKVIGCEPKELFFTSGGTESNNIAIFGSVMQRRKLGNKIVTTAIEHSSVLRVMEQLEKQGFEVVYLKPDLFGNISKNQIINAIDKNTILVSIMCVNNEVGSIMPINEIKSIIKAKNSRAVFHTDAVQAFGKIPINVKRMGIDLLSMSAHKIHGLKGAGALYISKDIKINPITFGGGQEHDISPGTEPMPAIAGFKGALLELGKSKNVYSKILDLNNYCRERLSNNKNVRINSPKNGLPYILNISVNRIKSETMTNFLSSNNIYVSNGSACSKGNRSHVLSAMGLPADIIDSSIRISFSRFNTREDIDCFIKCLNQGIDKLIKF